MTQLPHQPGQQTGSTPPLPPEQRHVQAEQLQRPGAQPHRQTEQPRSPLAPPRPQPPSARGHRLAERQLDQAKAQQARERHPQARTQQQAERQQEQPPLWTAEHVVDVELAVRLIEAQFPELAPVRLDTVGEGYDNTVYRVNSAYTFRFPRRTIAAKLLQTECALLPALERLGLPLAIPLLRYAGRPAADDAYPWPFAGYSFLPGQPPGPAAAAARARAVEPLALFLRRLHRFPAAEARALGVPGDELGRMDLAKRLRQLDASLEQAQRLGLWPASALPPVLAAIDTVRPLASCIADRPRMLVHGDLHIRNVVADDEGTLTGIIDWGDVHVGDAALDLSIAYSYVPPAERGRFFALYGQEPDETTARLARFFAVYVGFVLLVYGRDRGNEPLVAAARHSIENALLTE